MKESPLLKYIIPYAKKNIVPLLSREYRDTHQIQSAFSSYFPIWALSLQQQYKRPLLLLTPTDEMGRIMAADFSALGQHVPFLPAWGSVMGTPISEHAHVRKERAAVLYNIASCDHDIIISSVRVWNQFLPPPELLQRKVISLSVGDAIDPTEIVASLVGWNYLRVPKISYEGEVALRGEVIDVYISENFPGNHTGIRISFDFDSIESIKIIDIHTQMSVETIESVRLHPRAEFMWHDDSLERLEQYVVNHFPEMGQSTLNMIREAVTTYRYDEWEYLYYPFSLEKYSHLVDFFTQPPLVLQANYELYQKHEDMYWKEYNTAFLDVGRMKCIPRTGRYIDFLNEYRADIETMPIWRINTTVEDAHEIGDIMPTAFSANMQYFSSYIKEQITVHNKSITVCASGELQGERLRTLCGDELCDLPSFSVITADIHDGFLLKDSTVEVFTEANVLGKRLVHIDSSVAKPIFSLDQLEQGNLVVHIQYGVGKFIGLVRLHIRGVEKDFIQITYAHNENLYVPIEQMNMVQRYIGRKQEDMSLDSIGGTSWERKKSKIRKEVEDMSKELLDLHAKRSLRSGFSFPDGGDWERQFIEAFPYEPTDDQNTAWEEIQQDMESQQPMDRLLVGDVGFGKTELAFRSAFRAVSSGKQVLFLVPTTILAEQHYNSALERFRAFPVTIAMLSRFVGVPQQKTVLEDMKKGSIDIVIGTHRVIQKDIECRDLGLVIVDEEHKFGVKHKEAIKSIKYSVDCLSLSATPIPRTLYQSIVQLKDFSVLKTPPKTRKPIRTFVERYSDDIVRRAILTELDRGGQVFVLHNRVKSLPEMKKYLETLVPQATIVTASGQMQSKNLENAMHTFVHGGANVLVSTTIIENGIDIPSVNTIIIDRADNYGISQLYQLRGRVGRSDRTSYAYLLYPDHLQISDVALKRLSTISDHSELGSGFQVAMYDLEMRGSGNLLGKEQSGSIFAVGYEYYIQMLDTAMKKIKGEPAPAQDPVLDLEFSGFIPDTYISDAGTKMEVYKQIVSIASCEESENIFAMISDKYGTVPQEILSLFDIANIRMLCKRLHIYQLKDRGQQMELHVSQLALLPAKRIQQLVQEQKIRLHTTVPNVLIVPCKNTTLKEKYTLLLDYLSDLDDDTA